MKSLIPTKRQIAKAAFRGIVAASGFTAASFLDGITGHIAHLGALFFALRAIGGLIGDAETALLDSAADRVIGRREPVTPDDGDWDWAEPARRRP